jgi:hypothetical protein
MLPGSLMFSLCLTKLPKQCTLLHANLDAFWP